MADTYPSEVWPSDVTVTALNGTTDQNTGLPYISVGTGPASSPSYRIQFDRFLQRFYQIVAIIRQLQVVQEETALTVGVYPGDYRLGGTEKRFTGATAQSVTNNATRYVYIDSSNALQIASSYPADITTFVPLATVVASGGVITSINDDRGHMIATVLQTTSSSDTGTDNTSFILDADNAGAGVDQQLRFNRGSTDAEDAACEWDESNDRFNFYTQHSTKTMSSANLLSLLISGTTILDTNGVRKVASNGVNTTKGVTQSSGILELKVATSSGTGFDGSGNLAVQVNDGIAVGASGLDVDIVSSSGLKFTGGELDANVDDSTIEINSSNGIQAKDGGLAPAKMANFGASTGAVPFVVSATLSGGNTVSIFNANAPFKFRVLDAWSAATSADGGTWQVDNGTTAITDAVTVTGTDKTINRAGTLDDSVHEIAASGTLRVVGDGANADCIVYVNCMKVA